MRVAGSLWSVPSLELDGEARRLAGAGLQVWHWDCADGTIDPPGGFTADIARRLAVSTHLRSEAHLMLADPRPQILEWTEFCELIVVHVESPYWRESIEAIRSTGRRAGVAISPATVLPADLDHSLAVLVMTVAPGHAGSEFRADRLEVLDHTADHQLRGVDGSIDAERAGAARDFGANWIVSGTALSRAQDPRAWLAQFAAGIDEHRHT